MIFGKQISNFDIFALREQDKLTPQILNDFKVFLVKIFLYIEINEQMIVEWIFNDMKIMSNEETLKPLILEFLGLLIILKNIC